MSHPQIKFGTDGWRGVIADDFTFANVRTAAAAIAAYIHAQEDPAKGLCIGYDTRFGSRAFAGACAEVVAATGIRVALANDITPTPALSFGVRGRGAAGGIMITSSHNPAEWNGPLGTDADFSDNANWVIEWNNFTNNNNYIAAYRVGSNRSPFSNVIHP